MSTTPAPAAKPSPLWTGFGSQVALVFWSALTAAVVLTAASIPQGWLADQLLRSPLYVPLRTLDRLGLTDVARSPWLWAAAAGWLGAILAHALQPRRRLGTTASVTLRARNPERSLDQALAWGRSIGAGRPQVEHTEGGSVIRFEPADRSWVLQAGLWLTFVSAALALHPADAEDSMVRVKLEAFDRATQNRGVFDLSQNEPIQLFGGQVEHAVVTYLPDKDGLGPAVQMTRSDPREGSRTTFWVYADAPPEFDAAHRGGPITFRVLSADIVARPGSGLAARPASWLLVLALMVAGLGWATWTGDDRWRFEIRGDEVRALVQGPQPERSLDRLAPSLAAELAG